MSLDNLLAKSKLAGVRPLRDRESHDSNDEPIQERVLAKEERMAQIKQLVKDNSLKEAQERANQLVLQYPVEAKIHADLGGIMYKMGDYESAEIHASVAVLLAPGSYMMRHFRAMCSEKRQDFPAARDDYNVMALQSKQMHEKVAAHKQWQRMGQLIKGVEATQEQELSGCERSKKSRSSSVKPRINLETIKNRSLQLRRHAIDIVSDALLKAPRNEIQPTATPLADSTAATKATAHDDSMTNADVMYEKLHRPSTYRGRPIPENSTFWPRTDTLCSSYQPGSPVCTPTKPRLQCDTVTDADLADEAFQSSPESMHEQPDSAFRQQPGLPFCWGAASPVERSKRQLSNAHAYKKAGDEAYRTKRFPEALDQYTNSIATLPDNAVLLNNRASVYLKLRRWEEARADSTAALYLRPPRGTASKARCRIAKTMLVEKNIVEADDVVQVGLYEDPEHTDLNVLQALIMKIRADIVPPDQTCCQDQPSHFSQHRPTSTSFTRPESGHFNPDQLKSPPRKHSSAAVSDSSLATAKAESTLCLAKPVAESDMTGSLAVQEGHGVVPVGAIAKATQLYGTSSNHATAMAQAGSAKRKSPSRSTVKPGALATLHTKPAAVPHSASHHRAAAPLDSITEAEEHAANTASGAGYTKSADAAAPTAAGQESASRAAIRATSQSVLPEQGLASRTATHPAAAKQVDSESIKTVAPSSSLPGAASASPAFAQPHPLQPLGRAKTVSCVRHSPRPESTSMTLDQSCPAAAAGQAEAALESAAVQAAAAAAAASGMTASAASRFQVQGCRRNAPGTSALRAVVNQQPRSDPAVPYALPAKPQPGKKKHAKPLVSSSMASQAESANNTTAGLGSSSAASVQPHYNSSDNVHQHLASHASNMQHPACKMSARHEVDSFKQVWSELRLGGRDCNKQECPPWDDEPLLQSDQPAEADDIESFLQ